MVVTLDLGPIATLSHERFYELCMANRDIPMERNPTGALIIMPPVDGESGRREADFIVDLGLWHRKTGLGEVFSSSTIFKLPGGGDRSPDAAWVRKDRWEALTPEQQRKFPPLCPDFVVELRSESDRLKPLQAKMQEYLNSGLRLGWLINPQDKTVEIYRAGKDIESVSLPTELSGEDVLPGFLLQID
ncbi:MAG: Uma2 family endonuclease [Cyanobacteria bacterium J06642_2]